MLAGTSWRRSTRRLAVTSISPLAKASCADASSVRTATASLEGAGGSATWAYNGAVASIEATARSEQIDFSCIILFPLCFLIDRSVWWLLTGFTANPSYGVERSGRVATVLKLLKCFSAHSGVDDRIR